MSALLIISVLSCAFVLHCLYHARHYLNSTSKVLNVYEKTWGFSFLRSGIAMNVFACALLLGLSFKYEIPIEIALFFWAFSGLCVTGGLDATHNRYVDGKEDLDHDTVLALNHEEEG